jgi:CheY-like chemotaxis protein
VLLVEDNEDDVFLMKRAWMKAGVTRELKVAIDGQAAVEFLQTAVEQSQNLPCLVLLDLKMPRVPGLEVLSWMRKQPGLSKLPVVILTASSAFKDIEAAYELGANSYFSKPESSDQLCELTKLLDNYWLKNCLLPPAHASSPPND